jgi:hypothetical protein
MRLKMRRANLDDDLHDLFEQNGKQVVAMALALGSNQGTGLRTHPVAAKVAHGAERLGRTTCDDGHGHERRDFLDHIAGDYRLVPRGPLMPATAISSPNAPNSQGPRGALA